MKITPRFPVAEDAYPLPLTTWKPAKPHAEQEQDSGCLTLHETHEQARPCCSIPSLAKGFASVAPRWRRRADDLILFATLEDILTNVLSRACLA